LRPFQNYDPLFARCYHGRQKVEVEGLFEALTGVYGYETSHDYQKPISPSDYKVMTAETAEYVKRIPCKSSHERLHCRDGS